MKKNLLILIILILCSQLSLAQNMVANGSFEQYTTCPTLPNDLYKCIGWQNGNHASSDYFNECNTTTMDVPQNFVGYQAASDGIAYAGIIVHQVNSNNYAEYLLTAIQQLTPGHSYQVSFKVSLSDSSRYASDGIAAYFFNDAIGVDTFMLLSRIDVEPQVNFESFGPATNNTGWTTLIDTFVADSAYKHIMIGRFVNTSEVDTIVVSPNVDFGMAYYYIDEVSVTDITPVSVYAPYKITGIVCSPNPFTHSTNLSFSNQEQIPHSLNIFNIEGRLIRKIEDIRNSEVLIERENLDAGCYFYELKSEDGALAKGKLLVQ